VSDVYSPPQEPLKILHHDHQIVLVDKPDGLLSVPGKGEHLADCMFSRLERVFPGVLLVHRLDRDTSGVMVFALTPSAHRHLGQQFEKRQTRKVYIARVWGAVEEREGTISLPLIVDWPNRPLQKVDFEAGREAITDWRAQRQEEQTTRMRLMPRTGRSHQLRVHMREFGHPILGDRLYASGPAREAPRLMLHAESLRFRHPDGGKSVTFSCPCPF
jgi:tRNA pseudouridine32 synthase / 23S rRNA pseudouridine746 synthase